MTDTARPQGANPELERSMICTNCGEKILVCGAVSDLNPDVFVGMACGCRKPRLPWEQLFQIPKEAAG